MLDTLGRLRADGGPLVGVAYSLFEGSPQFITAVGLRFEAAAAVFRAVAEDDTLAASFGPLEPEPGEMRVEVGRSAPWSGCLGAGVCWGWELTNQQGYTDGVRLEFREPGGPSRAVVELVVVASAVQVFVAVAAGPAEPHAAADRGLVSE